MRREQRKRPGPVPRQDRYLLRLCIWCHPCETLMEAGVETTGANRRIYTCADCRRWVLAESVESRTWHAASRRANLNKINERHRAAMLRLMLTKVIVGPGADELDFVWTI